MSLCSSQIRPVLTDNLAQCEMPYEKVGKRILDVTASLIALVTLSPIFGLLALLVRLTSPGPIFYRQERVGRNGMTFKIAKFRSMFVNSDRAGLLITSSGDRRITPVGRILRASKLDEIPQLWNVMKGDMSLVGPRPEVPSYVQCYSTDQREVLRIRPGITDPASIAYREEEKLLAGQVDPDRFYREVLLPHKIQLNREYLKQISFRQDLYLLLRTLSVVLFPKPMQRESAAGSAPTRAGHSSF